MRRYRPLLAVPVVSALFAAGPFVGVAHAANVQFSSSSPANGATVKPAPTQVVANFSESVNSTTAAVRKSSIAMTYQGNPLPCTAAGGLGSTTPSSLTCAPATFADGVYHVSGIAWASNSLDGGVAYSFDFVVNAHQPVLQSQSPASNAVLQTSAGSPVVSATYNVPLDTAKSAIMVQDKKLGTMTGTTSFSSNGETISWTPSTALTDAGSPYTVTVHAVDVAGNPTTTSIWQFTADNTAPATPTFTTPAYVNMSNVAAFPVTGSSGEPGLTVTLTTSDGTNSVISHATTGSTGAWSAAPNLSTLADGTVTFSAVATDAAGNVSEATATPLPSAQKDVTAPSVTIGSVSPSPLNIADGTNVTVSGTADPGNGILVTLSDGTNNATGSGSAGDDGKYTVSGIDASQLADGPITVTVQATEAGSGNTASVSQTVTKDVVAPGAPSLNMPAYVNSSNQSNVPLSGVADPSSTSVTVSFSGTKAGVVTPSSVSCPTAVVNHQNVFSCNADLSQYDDGSTIDVTAAAIDANNNASAPTTSSVAKDITAPAAPTVAVPDFVNIANKSAVPVSGTAEPNSTVNIAVTDTASPTHHVVNDTAATNGAGVWVTTLDLSSLADGPLTYTVSATDQAGNTGDAAAPSTSQKDTVAPSAPTSPSITTDHGNVTSKSVTVTGSCTCSTDDTVNVLISSDGGSGTATGSAPVTKDNVFSVTVDATNVPDGTLSASATQTDAAGNTGPASTVTHAVMDTTTTLQAISATPVDASSVQNAQTVGITFNEQLDLSKSSVTLQDSTGNTLATSQPALKDGKTTIYVTPVDNPLPEDVYTLTATVKDLSDTDSLTTSAFTFTVDRTAPSAPSLSTLGNATVNNSALVPVSGTTTEKFGSVTVTLTDSQNNTASAKVDVGDSTSWSTSVDASKLVDGAITATAVQTDSAGNVSDVSSDLGATKDTVAPSAPAFATVGPASKANVSSVPLSGTGVSGDTVNLAVTDGTNAVNATVPVTNSSWSATVNTSSLTDGVLTVSATEVDSVGNASTTATHNLTKDTVGPTAAMKTPSAPFATTTSIPATWSGTDTGSGIASYDVRYRVATSNGGFGGYVYPTAWQHTTAASGTLPSVVAGDDYCFAVRSRDQVGNVSGWTADRCTAVVFDDRSLATTGTWTRGTGSNYYDSTESASSTNGNYVSRSGVQADRFELIATRCSTCGSVSIYVGGTLLKSINLYNATTQYRWTYAFTTAYHTGALQVKVTSANGKTVQIDGLGISRT